MENFSNNMQNVDVEILIKYIETLKNEGKIWNDADFCSKVGIPRSYLSDLKAGRKDLNEPLVRKIRRAFPDFGCHSSVSMDRDEPTLGEVARMIADHDRRFHDQMERIMDAMGIAPKKVASM
jgi:hypothetical protein